MNRDARTIAAHRDILTTTLAQLTEAADHTATTRRLLRQKIDGGEPTTAEYVTASNATIETHEIISDARAALQMVLGGSNR